MSALIFRESRARASACIVTHAWEKSPVVSLAGHVSDKPNTSMWNFGIPKRFGVTQDLFADCLWEGLLSPGMGKR